jgi:RimJ/RimL family protein N-acetyltransferase
MAYRKLLPADGPAFAQHLGRLSGADRRLRFMGGMSDEAVRAHARRLDWLRCIVIGYFDRGTLRGAAEIQLAERGLPLRFEGAFTVETAWQGRGVGTELLRRALTVARNRAAQGLRISCFSDNHRIQHIGQKFGAEFHQRAGQADGEIRLAAPTLGSVCSEGCDESWGWLLLWLDRAAALAPQVRARSPISCSTTPGSASVEMSPS